jgi:hypothetical protein
MRLSIEGLAKGAEAHLEPYVAANLIGRASDVRQGLEPSEAGALMAAAVLAGGALVSAVATSPLVGIGIGDPLNVTFPPDALPHHPMIGPWIGESLGEAVGRVLMTGAIGSGITPGAPTFRVIEISEASASFWGDVLMSFVVGQSRLQVVAHYGARPADPGVWKTVRISADALARVGIEARQLALSGAPLIHRAPAAAAVLH